MPVRHSPSVHSEVMMIVVRGYEDDNWMGSRLRHPDLVFPRTSGLTEPLFKTKF